MEAESRPMSEGSKRKRRLPKGMSEYQAAWITEDLGDLEGDSSSEGEEEADNRQGGDAEPRFGLDGTASMADLEEEDDQTDDMQVRRSSPCTCKDFAHHTPLPCGHDEHQSMSSKL